MSKKFNYTKMTGHYYCQYSDEWEEDGVEFDYEVEDKDLLPHIIELVYNDYFGENDLLCDNEERINAIKEELRRFINDTDLIEPLSDSYEHILKDIFQQEAFDFHND